MKTTHSAFIQTRIFWINAKIVYPSPYGVITLHLFKILLTWHPNTLQPPAVHKHIKKHSPIYVSQPINTLLLFRCTTHLAIPTSEKSLPGSLSLPVSVSLPFFLSCSAWLPADISSVCVCECVSVYEWLCAYMVGRLRDILPPMLALNRGCQRPAIPQGPSVECQDRLPKQMSHKWSAHKNCIYTQKSLVLQMENLFGMPLS